MQTSRRGPADAARKKKLVGWISLCGAAAWLGTMAWLRRHPGTLDGIYDAGNVLDTHKGTGLSLYDFGRGVGHAQLALLALLMAAAAKHILTRRYAGVAATLGAFAVVFADSTTRFATRVGSHLYIKPCDDALISMRYARNLAEGRGLVYNAGEVVDGFTNPLLTWLMVLPHSFGLHEGLTPIPILLLGGAALAGMAFFSCVLLEEAGVPLTLQIVIALLMMFDQSLFEFTVVCLETPLLGFGVALVMAGAAKKRERWITVGSIVLTLSRADGAVVAVMVALWTILEEAASGNQAVLATAKVRWRRFAIIGIVAAALVLWRFLVYGHPAPNTAYLKVYSLAARLRTGLASYGVRGLAMYGVPVLFVLWAAHADRSAQRARRLLAPVLGVWAYAMYVGGDAFNFMRFLGPVTPMLWTAVGLAASSAWAGTASKVRAALAMLFLLIAPIQSERGVLGMAWDRSDEIKSWVTAAKTLEHNVPEDQEIATFYAGLPYYAPTRRFIDVLGKADAHIAHLSTIHGAIPGHNKFDFQYVYETRRVGVTFSALGCDDASNSKVDDLREIARGLGSHKYQAPIEQLLDPTFRDLYLPHRVVLREGEGPAGHPVGCWFVRKDSGVPIAWQVAVD